PLHDALPISGQTFLPAALHRSRRQSLSGQNRGCQTLYLPLYMMNLYRILSVTSQSYRKSQSDGHRSRFFTTIHGSLVNNHAMVSVHSLEPGSDFGKRYAFQPRSEEHTSELQSRENLVCRLLLEKKNTA